MKNIRSAFTLIELLVVIAIMAILASMLFPSFSRAREMARRASCSSNMRQLGLAFQQYVQDYDERLPNATNGSALVPAESGEGHEGGWVFFDTWVGSGTMTNNDQQTFRVEKGSLFPYVKNSQVYVCPSDTMGQSQNLSYGYNSCMMTPTGRPKPGKSIVAFDNSAEWMLLGEEARESGRTDGSTDDGYFTMAESFAERHFNGGNMLFLDSHVKFIRASQARKWQTGGDDTATSCP